MPRMAVISNAKAAITHFGKTRPLPKYLPFPGIVKSRNELFEPSANS